MKNLMMVTLVCVAVSLTACNPNMWRGHTGKAGKDGLDGAVGAMGPVGPTGPQGEPGQPGESCSVVKLGSVTNITCGGSTVQVMDGVDGENAQGLETLALCPALQGGSFKEYVLKIGEEHYAVFASGNLVGLTKLFPGNWTTTDGRNCHFTITADGQLQY